LAGAVEGLDASEPGKWWATLESNQAWVSPAELQSAAAPCSTSPDAGGGIPNGPGGVKQHFRADFRGSARRGLASGARAGHCPLLSERGLVP